MSPKYELTPQKLKSIKKSLKNPKKISDVKVIEEFNKITDKTLKETIQQEQLKDKSQIPSKKEMCQFLQDEFSQSQLVDIIIEIHKNQESSSWNSLKENSLKESLESKSSHQLCQKIKILCPDLMRPTNFNFFKNYLKNIKAKHVIGGLAMVALVGGLFTYYTIRSEQLMNVDNKIIDSLKYPFQGITTETGTYQPLISGISKNVNISIDYEFMNILKKNKAQAILTYLTGAIMGTLPSLVNTFKQKNKKMSQKKKIENFVNQIKEQNQSIKRLQDQIRSIKKKSLRRSQ